MEQLKFWSGCSVALAVADDAGCDDPPAPADRSEAALASWLSDQIGRPIQVVYTDNRSTMLSCREKGRAIRLRLHSMFREAGPEIMLALAAYIGFDDSLAGSVLDSFIAYRSAELPRVPVNVQPMGRFHDLGTILEELNRVYFHGACQARITWGTAGPRRYRRSIQLGVYIGDDQLIRIHPCLDQAFVPHHYLAWVVFHEMLHEVFGVEGDGSGRRCLHPPEFQAIEESYPDYAVCKRWEDENLHRLLSYGRPQRHRSGAR